MRQELDKESGAIEWPHLIPLPAHLGIHGPLLFVRQHDDEVRRCSSTFNKSLPIPEISAVPPSRRERGGERVRTHTPSHWPTHASAPPPLALVHHCQGSWIQRKRELSADSRETTEQFPLRRRRAAPLPVRIRRSIGVCGHTPVGDLTHSETPTTVHSIRRALTPTNQPPPLFLCSYGKVALRP